MGSYSSKNKTWVPRALDNNPEQVKRLTDLLKVKSKHEQKVALRGWDSHQRELVNNILFCTSLTLYHTILTFNNLNREVL